MADAKPLKIVEYQGENLKRMRAFNLKLDPKGNVVLVTGENNQGKTSLMDGIAYVLGGAKLAPAKPIRDGAISATGTLKLGDGQSVEYEVTRVFTQGKASTLTVTDKSGGKISSPQAFCDALYANLAFDPVAFTRLKPEDQRAVLLTLPSLNLNQKRIDEIDVQHKKIFDERTIIGRDVDRTKKLSQSIPLPEPGLPAVEVSISELSGELTAIQQHAMELQHEHSNITSYNDAIRYANEKIAEHKRAIEVEEETIVARQGDIEQANSRIAQITPLCGDQQEIELKIANAEGTNSKIRKERERLKYSDEFADYEKKYKSMTAQLELLKSERQEILNSAVMPLDGLSYDEKRLVYNGQPFEQLSSSEKMRVSLAIAMAGNPQLRVVLIPDASLLDKSSMLEIERMSQQHDFQVWMERVGTADPVGIVIVDGSVAEVKVAPAEPEPSALDHPEQLAGEDPAN
jgi:hypothetical protein